MGVATVTSKGQLTIPADVRAEYGIESGHKVYFYKRLDGQLGIKIIKPQAGAGRGALRDYADQMRGDSIDEAINQSIHDAMADKMARSELKL